MNLGMNLMKLDFLPKMEDFEGVNPDMSVYPKNEDGIF